MYGFSRNTDFVDFVINKSICILYSVYRILYKPMAKSNIALVTLLHDYYSPTYHLNFIFS